VSRGRGREDVGGLQLGRVRTILGPMILLQRGKDGTWGGYLRGAHEGFLPKGRSDRSPPKQKGNYLLPPSERGREVCKGEVLET